jgi:deazaflavin-dependent oxidoreductase (nitroreductase family)
MSLDWAQMNREVIDEFRANGGQVARFGGLPVVVLHTIGARSKKVLEVPLILIVDGEEMLVFGSAAGSPRHPSWYYNLRAHPEIEVEYGSERFAARIKQLPAAAARERVAEQARNSEQFAGYLASAAPREIPVFSIQRI